MCRRSIARDCYRLAFGTHDGAIIGTTPIVTSGRIGLERLRKQDLSEGWVDTIKRIFVTVLDKGVHRFSNRAFVLADLLSAPLNRDQNLLKRADARLYALHMMQQNETRFGRAMRSALLIADTICGLPPNIAVPPTKKSTGKYGRSGRNSVLCMLNFSDGHFFLIDRMDPIWQTKL